MRTRRRREEKGKEERGREGGGERKRERRGDEEGEEEGTWKSRKAIVSRNADETERKEDGKKAKQEMEKDECKKLNSW